MIPNILSMYAPAPFILVILLLAVYVGIPVLIISALIRMVRYFKTASNEQKRMRMELGKVAEEVHLMRQHLMQDEKQGGSATEDK